MMEPAEQWLEQENKAKSRHDVLLGNSVVLPALRIPLLSDHAAPATDYDVEGR